MRLEFPNNGRRKCNETHALFRLSLSDAECPREHVDAPAERLDFTAAKPCENGEKKDPACAASVNAFATAATSCGSTRVLCLGGCLVFGPESVPEEERERLAGLLPSDSVIVDSPADETRGARG